MTPRTEGILLIVLMIALSVVFQVQMKLLAIEIGGVLTKPGQGWSQYVAALVNVAVGWRGLGVAALAGSLFVIWLIALTRVELSVALPLASIALVVAAVGGGAMLGEHLSWLRIAGIVTTAVGIGLVVGS